MQVNKRVRYSTYHVHHHGDHRDHHGRLERRRVHLGGDLLCLVERKPLRCFLKEWLLLGRLDDKKRLGKLSHSANPKAQGAILT